MFVTAIIGYPTMSATKAGVIAMKVVAELFTNCASALIALASWAASRRSTTGQLVLEFSTVPPCSW